jgi:NADPH:quinone reductase-like Zn-dependent oxidoreductase
MPEPSHGEALVKVKAASINPGEAKIREGLLHAMWPATFPTGEGSDLAGVVTKVGPGVESVTIGDEVIGFTDRRASPANHEWLAAHGVQPERYGTELVDRLREARIDAFIDAHGGGYVKLAVELGVSRDRIDTIIDFAAAREYRAKAEGSSAALNASVLAELAALIASGDLEVPIAATFPLDQVRAAFSRLAQGHIRGKIVLLP